MSILNATRQYVQFKAKHPGYVLLFRIDDGYEMFREDAKLAAKVLGIPIGSRSGGEIGEAIPMARVPVHAVEGCLRKLISAGHKVAICEEKAS